MLPELFRIGNFFLPTYGLLITLGFLSGLWLTCRLARRAGLDREAVLNLGIYSALAGIVGAKLLMLLLDLDYYLAQPREIFSFSTLQAGGIYHGGLIAALLAAVIYMRRKQMPVVATMDLYAPGLALGHAIGRLGCFSAGCCWGVESHLPWAVTFTNPTAHRLFGTPIGVPLHPAQLYEVFAVALIFVLLYRRYLRPHGPGVVIGLYLALYSGVRFLIEFVRVHDQANPYIGAFTLQQWLAVGLGITGAWLIWRARRLDSVRLAKHH